jgi:hypothetical protein
MGVVYLPPAILSGKKAMVKSCCAVGCTNRHQKGNKLSFYRFPVDSERRARWIAAIRRQNWQPTKHSFLCSAHFITGKKSQDPLSPDYVPSIFTFVNSPEKNQKAIQLRRYTSRKQLLQRKRTALTQQSGGEDSQIEGQMETGDCFK